jgi:hypothetical protein
VNAASAAAFRDAEDFREASFLEKPDKPEAR